MADITLLVFVSDTHCGSTVAICPPEIHLDDGGFYGASKLQLWLWERWGWFWERVERTCDEFAPNDIRHIYNGDIVDGDHHQTPQIINRNPGAQWAVAYQALQIPMALNPDHIFFVRGTEVHVGAGAATEEAMAKYWAERGHPVEYDIDTGNASTWHLKMDVQGLEFDIAHHGRTGHREHTRGSIAHLFTADTYLSHRKRGERPPDVLITSHFHRWNEATFPHIDDEGIRRRVIFRQLPAWQLATGYVHKKHTHSMADIGGLILVVRDGVIIHEDQVDYRAARSTVWRRGA